MMWKRFAMAAPLLAALLWAVPAAAGLKDYVAAPDDSYAFEVVETIEQGANTVHKVRLTSQTWQGIAWEHWLTIFVPEEIEHPDKSMLFIGGGDNIEDEPRLQSGEAQVVGRVATATQSVVSMLQQVPNQPLFDGLYEDAIIAYTYERFLNDEGNDWPLLYPMVKSAVRAMDTVTAVVAENYDAQPQRFMMTGGSKRGWTTWLTAVVDPRVEQIAPLIIDTLNMPEQMPHHYATYGGYSESIIDYTNLGLQERMQEPRGQLLASQVDPYSWREELTLPKLVVLGTNDPYWTVDAAQFYYDDLVGYKRLYYQANTGHDVSVRGVATITQFYDAMLNGTTFPDLAWTKEADGTLTVTWAEPGGTAKLWEATSPNRDFRESRFASTPLEGDGEVRVTPDMPTEGWKAYYVEVTWPGAMGMPFGLTTEMVVMPDSFPEEGTRTYDLIDETEAGPGDQANAE